MDDVQATRDVDQHAVDDNSCCAGEALHDWSARKSRSSLVSLDTWGVLDTAYTSILRVCVDEDVNRSSG